MVPHFIVGVPRSGTTLLRTILDSHPVLAVGPECPWIAGVYGKAVSFKDLYQSLIDDTRGPAKNFKGLRKDDIAYSLGIAIKSILDQYCKAKGKKFWIEKTPSHITEIPFLVSIFPNARFIHIIRDGRDVACSSYNERKTWGRYLKNGSEAILNTRLNALRRWNIWITQFLRWQEAFGLEVCTIHYEDLVDNPAKTVKKILGFTGIGWTESMLNYKIKEHDFPSWEAGSRDVDNSEAIFKSSIGKWKSVFTKTEKLITASIADSLLVSLGYEPTLRNMK